MTNDQFAGDIFSKGLYSSWCHMPFMGESVLFDAGEGAATRIGNGLTNVTKVLCTHSHGDHVLGLPSIIGCRNAARGTSRDPKTFDHNKPLDIYYPADNADAMADLLSFIKSRYSSWLRYKLTFHPIEVGVEVPIGTNITIRTIAMKHQKWQTTLGYVVGENRRKLNPKFAGQDIAALKRGGLTDADLMVSYRKNLFAYCLDAYKIEDTSLLRDCERVVMDCTFLNAKDRDEPTHFTMDESLNICNDLGVKHMFAAHLSPRYSQIPHDSAFGNMEVTVIDPDLGGAIK